ncbi:MAG: CheR family methyltransferase, partial [Candidatus Eremiobacterota bacterium]
MNIPEHLLRILSDLINKKTGLCFPESKWKDLERAVISHAKTLNVTDPYLCINSLLASPEKDLRLFVENLTVGETYFFRDRRIFGVLEEKILPLLIEHGEKRGKYLKIWSAGCSTGEEPYSIAICVHKIISHIREWNIKIMGTDINTVSLEKAGRGIYTDWSFRETPPSFKEKYFDKINDHSFSIKSDIKKTVTFSCLNLAEDVYPDMVHNTDIIFCRNVLMYFSHEIREKIISRFYDALVQGGWFFISPSEALCLEGSKFVPVNFPCAILYKKDIYNKIFYINTDNVQTLPVPEDYSFPCEQIDSEISDDSLSSSFSFSQNASVPASELAGTEQFKEEPAQGNDIYELSLKLYEQGHYREISQMLEDFFSKGHMSSSHTGSMIILAKSYSNQKKYASAEEWCKKAIEYNRTDKYYYYLMSTILQEENKIEEAIISLKK